MKNNILHFLFIFALLLLPSFSYAQNYKVTPRVIDREVLQRDIFTETVTITNNKTHQINIYATVNEVAVDDGGDIADFTPPSVSDNTDTPTSWLAISRSRITVGPGKTIEVPLSFKINPQAKSGVYHLFVGFGTGNNRPTAEKQVNNGQAPGVIVTLSVAQETSEFLKLSKFIIDKFVTKVDNTAITYTLSNPGSADVVPRGEIIFSDSRGGEVSAIDVNPNGESLAPGQETTYIVAAPTEDMMGKYKAFLSVDYGSAQLASVYDTAFFYVLPLKKLIAIFLILLLVAAVVTAFLHRRLGPDDVQHDGSEELPLYVSDNQSIEKDHDINLKK